MQTENINSALSIEDDEITLKELILKIKSYVREVIRYWWIVLIFVGIGAGFMFYKSKKSRAEYAASLTFLIKTDGGISLGGLSSLLGTGSNSKLDRLVEFARSRRIIQTALFQVMEIEGVTDFYANHLIRDFELHKGWKKDTTGLKDFVFKLADKERLSDPTRFTRIENKVLLALREILAGKSGVYSSGYDKKSEILSLSLTTHNETLTIELLRTLYWTLTEFYLKEASVKENKTFEILQSKVDSVKRELDGKNMAAARLEDNSRGMFLQEDQEKISKLKREAMIAAGVYAEAVKNLAVAEISKQNSAPLIRELDMPIAPIKPEKLGLIKALAIGIGLGGFLGSLFVVMRKIFRDAMA